jgi:lysophospholipase L1-like esterase
MLSGWLAAHGVQVLRGRAGWFPLATCAVVLVVKSPEWTLWGALLAVLLPAAAGLRFWAVRRKLHWGKPAGWAGVAVLSIAWSVYAVDADFAVHTGRRPALDAARPVVCLGDSLTAQGYPGDLARLIAVPVVDLSSEGITTTRALQRLPELLAAKPQAVVVELGGNDFVQGKTRGEVLRNLEQIVTACRRQEIEVVLVEIPRGFVRDPYGGLERELARRHDLELVPDTPIRRFVLWSQYAPPGMWFDSSWHLSDDGLHPNERGNELLARYVADALERLYGEKMRSPSDS